MNPHFKENIILLAEVIIPQLHEKKSLEYIFLKNFKELFAGLEKDSADQIRLLIKVVSKLSYFYHYKAFNQLSYEQRTSYVNRLFHFPVGKITGGVNGVRSLLLIAYYSIDEVWEDINYEGPVKTGIS